jgi:hypothetical protein
VAGATVTAGPIIDMKATRVADPAASTAGKEPPKDATKDATKGPSSSVSAKPATPPRPETSGAGARGPSPATPVAPAAKGGAGFGSIAAAGLIGGVLGAGLLFAAEKAGIGGETGQLSAVEQTLNGKISALDQRVGTLAPKDALSALDKKVAAAEALAKQASEKPAGDGQAPASGGAAAVPADLTARLDSLDQRVAALQEEPGKDQGGNAATGTAQADSGKQLAELDARVKALEGADKPDAAPLKAAEEAAQQVNQAVAALKTDVEARTKQNADAIASLGQRLDSLQQAVDTGMKSATEASRKAAEASQAQVADATKTLDKRLAEQSDKIAALDKGLADRAPTSAVQAALRVVVADRVASALASGAPYAEPLASLRQLDPQAEAQAGALAPFADKGAPTASQLAATFRGIADKIAQGRQAAKTKAAAESGDFRTKLLSMADGLVQVRKVDAGPTAEAGPAAAPEEKVQAALDRGDLAAAAAAFDALPPEAKAQAGDFGTTLAARAKAAQASQALTEAAFQALPAPGAAPAAAPASAPAERK